MRVRVYRNLAKGQPYKYSVQQHVPGKGWRVTDHANIIILIDAAFKVSRAGRRRVLRTGHKNVHAYVEGTVLGFGGSDGSFAFLGDEVKYDPRKAGHFFLAKDEAPIYFAKSVVIGWLGTVVADGIRK